MAVIEYIESPLGRLKYYNILSIEEYGLSKLEKIPYSIRILLENVLRQADGDLDNEYVKIVAGWDGSQSDREVPFTPARVLLQDFTGVPAVVDLAAMRDALYRLGGDPDVVNPMIPTDLVIDHSIQVDYFGTKLSIYKNIEIEYARNKERYSLLKWAQNAFNNFRVVPPGHGIIHQVNLEYLARLVFLDESKDGYLAYPDSLLGTDSHTTMINGLGVFGWGVGGIEAEAVMLGQPYYILVPEVIGVEIIGELPEGATSTDLVLTLTELLRRKGVVGKFIEFYGPGLSQLDIPDRATIANMSPEYGATMGYFPVDELTINYLYATGRDPKHIKAAMLYLKSNNLFYNPEDIPKYTETIKFDLSNVEPSISGPTHPEDRIPLRYAKEVFLKKLKQYLESKSSTHPAAKNDIYTWEGEGGAVHNEDKDVSIDIDGEKYKLRDGAVVIAAITSCTNTSNPSVMIGAGLLAKKAVEYGLKIKPYIKTVLAPGSLVVTEYLKESGLLPYLEALGFHIVGYGCTVCIGNTGPLLPQVANAIKKHRLYTVAVLSGNRNFEGRIHSLVKANYLASPMLVIAYGLAGRMDIDLYNEPLSYDPNNEPVYLKDIWPSKNEINKLLKNSISPELFKMKYKDVYLGDERWRSLESPIGKRYAWDDNSTYIREPPFFKNISLEPAKPGDIENARVLMLLGDRVTTDHISPAGAIPIDSPAGQYLINRGIKPLEFNTYGSRRGNHEVMVRGTFSNIRIRNMMVPDKEGGWTIYIPSGEVMTVYDAAMKYMEEKTPLIVLAGHQYGAGSSRDWAAKGTSLLGIKAVIAKSFERIHRSNLVGMGVLPLQFMEGEGWRELGLNGEESFRIKGISEGLYPRKILDVTARKDDGEEISFKVVARLDTPMDVEYYIHGGILQYVLRSFLSKRR
jgi:aconitate hydratase